MKTGSNFSRLLIIAHFFLMLFCLPLKAGAAPSSFTNLSTADAYLSTGTNGEFSGNNFGAAGSLAIASGSLPEGEFQTVMRFNMGATRSAFDTQFGNQAWTVLSVTLQLTAGPHDNPIFNTPQAGAFDISLMQNDTWVEGTGTGGKPGTSGVSFNSLPTITGPNDVSLGKFQYDGSLTGQSSFSLTLTPQLVSDVMSGSDVNFQLLADSDVSGSTSAAMAFLFQSRKDPTEFPTLVVNAIPEPGAVTLWSLGAVAFALLRRNRR